MPDYNKANAALKPHINPDRVRRFQPQELVRQIGTLNYVSACGGRAFAMKDDEGQPYAVVMHAGSTYWITVELNYLDYYRVKRWMVRGGVATKKWEVTDIDFTQIGAAVYAASCYIEDEEGTDEIYQRELANQ